LKPALPPARRVDEFATLGVNQMFIGRLLTISISFKLKIAMREEIFLDNAEGLLH